MKINIILFFISGSRTSSGSGARDLAFREADVFMLCYKISDPASLFSALNFWCPEVRAVSPDAPIILVGCQSDLRGDRDVISGLAKSGRAPVSSDQALSFSRQISAVIYVETSAKTSTRSAISAFEVAGLASLGKIAPKYKVLPSRVPSTPSPEASLKKQRFSGSPGSSLDRQGKDNEVETSEQFWESFQYEDEQRRTNSEARLAKEAPPTIPVAPRTPNLSSSSRSASLSSAKSRARSNTSIPSSLSASSVFGSKTPKSLRKSSSHSNNNGAAQEKMITIKCQRLRSDKTYEEIEVEVPAPIYETIQLYNDTGSLAARKDRNQSRSFGAKLKNLFTKN
jgi:GTPase SAR1 family protein